MCLKCEGQLVPLLDLRSGYCVYLYWCSVCNEVRDDCFPPIGDDSRRRFRRSAFFPLTLDPDIVCKLVARAEKATEPAKKLVMA